MPFSKHSKTGQEQRARGREVREITQLGLDFAPTGGYSYVPRKETHKMNNELLEALENKVSILLEKYSAMKDENARLNEENQQLLTEREGLKSRVDAILGKLDAI